MAKGNNYPAPVTTADGQQVKTAITALKTALGFVPNLGPDVLTTASLSPERLPLADLAVQAAAEAPDMMRKSFNPATLQAKLAAYRTLLELLNQLEPVHERLRNAVNVLGGDIRFLVDNVHEDIEKDKGETQDLGQLRADIHAYYVRPGGRGPRKP